MGRLRRKEQGESGGVEWAGVFWGLGEVRAWPLSQVLE